MTRISPRVAQDRADLFTAKHLREDARAWRDWAIERLCILGIIGLAAAAAWLAHSPESCAEAVAWIVDPD